MKKPSSKTISEFVFQSNMIEDINYLGPVYDNHIIAAEQVVDNAEQGKFLEPTKIHSILMRGELEGSEVGAYRIIPVKAFGHLKPQPHRVFKLMEDFLRKIQEFLGEERMTGYQLELEHVCWDFHHYFECIHPFVDGNGRTGRLVLNNLRLLCGLDWHTVDCDKKQEYFNTISLYEKTVFLDEIKVG